MVVVVVDSVPVQKSGTPSHASPRRKPKGSFISPSTAREMQGAMPTPRWACELQKNANQFSLAPVLWGEWRMRCSAALDDPDRSRLERQLRAPLIRPTATFSREGRRGRHSRRRRSIRATRASARRNHRRRSRWPRSDRRLQMPSDRNPRRPLRVLRAPGACAGKA